MSAKSKSQIFFCTECGYESPKWLGQCPACGAWNAMSEAPEAPKRDKSPRSQFMRERPRPKKLSEITLDSDERMDTGLGEFTRVLGGGLVRGSLVLIGGNPGVGKSTLLLEASSNMAEHGRKVLYISGEESLSQIRMRAMRLNVYSEDLSFLAETDIDAVIDIILDTKPDLCIIDSIQTMYTDDASSVPGSVQQVRECAGRIMAAIKQTRTAAFLVGHLTKEGTVAGPRTLEHMVDAVLYFESGDQFGYRILRSVKNRFGSTNEIGVFCMDQDGLKEVKNPSEFLLEGRPHDATGAAVTCLIEGSRPLLTEVQGLTSWTQYAMPRRQANGMDYNRLSMLIAVLAKRCGIDLSHMDAYVNIAGGLRITEPSADLAVVAAIISSLYNFVIPEDTVIMGEVGLSGEVRSVPLIDERIREAAKLGFGRVIVPKVNLKSIKCDSSIVIAGAGFISDMLELLSVDSRSIQ